MAGSCHRNPPKATGTSSFKWLFQRWKNPEFCCLVSITQRGPSLTDFVEFPAIQPETLPLIDPSDRKFIAVANAHPAKPPILEATDSKWIGWVEALAAAGIHVEFVDAAFLHRIYVRKMGS